jgi:hypothetical protein
LIVVCVKAVSRCISASGFICINPAFLGFYLYKAGFYIDKTREFIIINSILFTNPTFPGEISNPSPCFKNLTQIKPD